MRTAERAREWRGPAVLSYGFRPFFFLAGGWAALAMGLWVAMLSGHEPLPTRLDPLTWHAHEFVFGYVSAVVTGFLLTAVPNWTGRLPVVGWPLGGLVGLWIIGRLAIALSARLPESVVLVASLSEVAVLTLLIAREILAGRNWRNLPVLGLLGLFLAADALFQMQAASEGAAFWGPGQRLGIAAAVMLIALVGGRVVPSFTRNWLAQRRVTALPAPQGPADTGALAAGAVACLAFVGWPETQATAALCTLAGLATLYRLSRWQGHRTWPEPLLWVLHVAYGFLALGFLSTAAGAIGLLPIAGALHLWLAGAIGLMTLAIMTRASLGHTGRALHAGPAIAATYAALILSVVARLAAAALPDQAWLLWLAAAGWIAGFGGFAAIYAPILLLPSPARRRPSSAPAGG